MTFKIGEWYCENYYKYEQFIAIINASSNLKLLAKIVAAFQTIGKENIKPNMDKLNF